MTIFDKIISKEIAADIVHEDEFCLAFKDIAPEAPTHILVIPKKKIESMAKVERSDKELIGHLVITASQIAEKLGHSEDGYRLVINTNDQGGQSVPYLHVHLLADRQMLWPPG